MNLNPIKKINNKTDLNQYRKMHENNTTNNGVDLSGLGIEKEIARMEQNEMDNN